MKLKDLVIIDWISPAAHENFNRSLVEALCGSFKTMYVFEKYDSIDTERMIELPRPNTRWRCAMAVRDLVARVHANDNIMLVTYDQKSIPLFFPHFRRILAFEHNTTPEKGSFKHVLWQVALTRSLQRLAQFPQQKERLSTLKQKVRFIGSPLSQLSSGPEVALAEPAVFLLPSARSDLMALVPHLGLFKGATLVCKAADDSFVRISHEAGVKVDVRKRLEFNQNGVAVSGVIVSVPSTIRGSGWVNDAIGHATPIITATEASTNIVKGTFPTLRFVQLEQLKAKEDFDAALRVAQRQDFLTLIQANNLAFKSALEDELELLV